MKNELEICVKSLDNFNKTINILKKQGFEIKEDFQLNDIYYVANDCKISLENSNHLLSNYILVRENVGKKIMFVLKEKKFDDKGNIISQTSCKCEIVDKEKGEKFIEQLKYKKMLEIKDHNILLSNGKHEIYVQEVENLGVYIEMEQKNIYSDNNNGDTIEDIITIFNSFNLHIDKKSYFVKKSYDMLEKLLK